MKSFVFHQPTKVIFGIGTRNQLKDMIPDHIKRIGIVTDKTLIENMPLMKGVIKQVESSFEVSIFDDIEENPSFETVDKAARYFESKACEWIIGIGGGSSMDAAKGISICANGKEPIRTYVEGTKPVKTALPIICIPTTSGTGSEVTPFAVFSDKMNRTKCGFAHKDIFPFAAIIDPELSYSMPIKIIKSSGLDVLSHALEAYLSEMSFPHNDMYALEAIQLVFKNLKRASEKQPQPMQCMSYASMLAGVAITHASTILPHIMGYPLTVFHSISHGLASFLTLPAFLKYLQEQGIAGPKLGALGKAIGGLERLEELASELEISLKLKSYGVLETQLELFAEQTIHKGDIQITPGNISKSDIIQIYQDSL